MDPIERVVNRCHVASSYLSVVRYAVSRVQGRRRGFLRLPRTTRRWFLRDVIKAHTRNRRDYTRLTRHGI